MLLKLRFQNNIGNQLAASNRFSYIQENILELYNIYSGLAGLF